MKILIVEDDKFYANTLQKELTKHILFLKQVDIVTSFEELKQNINYDLFIVDYFLPDAEGAHIDYLLQNNKSVITLTKYDKKFLKSKYKDKIVNYIIKEDVFTIKYLINFIKRLHKNKYLNALVIDDSKTIRNRIKFILKQLNLNTILCENGKQALEIINKEKIDLIITDINMPEMDGLEFTKQIRQKYSLEELPIIVISSESNEKLIHMLKFGANDFIHKPFSKEELTIRVNNTLDIFESFKKIKKEVQIDPMTTAYNRYFFEHRLEHLFETYETKTIAMLDIDHFKKVNDTYGHQTGDKVLIHFVKSIKNIIRKTDIVVRYGGEEFLIFMPNTTKQEAVIVLTKIKKSLTHCENINYTFSSGIADEGETLAEMIKIADERLYKAKENGRNQIVYK